MFLFLRNHRNTKMKIRIINPTANATVYFPRLLPAAIMRRIGCNARARRQGKNVALMPAEAVEILYSADCIG